VFPPSSEFIPVLLTREGMSTRLATVSTAWLGCMLLMLVSSLAVWWLLVLFPSSAAMLWSEMERVCSHLACACAVAGGGASAGPDAQHADQALQGLWLPVDLAGRVRNWATITILHCLRLALQVQRGALGSQPAIGAGAGEGGGR
jgi:hypothetical protein